uniref:Tetratricopeptide repeat protein 39B n=1 Tax=Timema genevievae TaxID=629358 RepID=A0A7R9JS58_TIMGE|nr:unnamed protein product [Timema genevievae]
MMVHENIDYKNVSRASKIELTENILLPSQDITKAGEAFMCVVYGGKRTDTFNELQYKMYVKNIAKRRIYTEFKLESLPPNSDAARQHTFCVYLQAAVRQPAPHVVPASRHPVGTWLMFGLGQVGLKELETGYKLNRSIRQILCVMTLLSYHLIVVHILSHMEGNLEFCDEILRSQLQMYPDGVWFLFFKGRLEFMKGNIEDSINWYVRSWKSQDMWPQFHHLCFWELMWTNSVKCEWREASTYASRLLEESRWSRTIYSYQRAAFLSMLEKTEYDADNRGLVLLLKGVSLRHMHSPLQAEECLKTVISLEKKLKEDNYLVPYALVELAFIYKEQGNVSKASQILEEAKKNYTGYSLESRLHFKIHSFQAELDEEKKLVSGEAISSI